jgi:cytochrome c oxidase subunit 2
LSQGPDEYRLDGGFWRAVIVMGVISALGMWGVVVFPIDHYLKEAAQPAADIDWIFRFMAFFSVPILVYVNGFLLYFAIRYRKRPSDSMDAVGSPIHDHRALEAWWTAIPAVLMLALGLISYNVLPKYYGAQAATVTMEAIGHKWDFEFRYPGLKQSVYNDLYLPVNVPVTMDITSTEVREEDAVIHSFWVPEFRVKQDMVPGLVVPIHFKPTLIGNYRIICTEFCGVGHSDMWGKVHVVSQSEFDAWFAKQQHQAAAGAPPVKLAQGDATSGQAVFQQRCSACHNAAPFDQKKVGPGLADLFDDPKHPNLVNGKKANPADAADILEHGYTGSMGTMPTMQANGLSAADIANLVAYLQSLHK